MGIQSRLLSGVIAGVFLVVVPLEAKTKAPIVSYSKDVVIVTPDSLPELAQWRGIAFQLYTDAGDGSCYLYIEQEKGERLLVLDVSDPAKIKQVNSINLNVPGPFDFVRKLPSGATLVEFRNNLGIAVLDFRKPRAPALKRVSALQNSGPTESLGNSAFLLVNEGPGNVPPEPRDYQVVDTSDPAGPLLLFTAKQVNDEIKRNETGTTFLLGADGLTIIRRPSVEEKHYADQTFPN